MHTRRTNPMVAESPAFGLELPAATRTVSRCRVCGFTEIFTDEVIDRGWLLLAECPRCEHRWTEAIPAPLAASSPAPRATPAPAQLPTPTPRSAPWSVPSRRSPAAA